MNCIIVHGCPSDEEKALDPARRTYDKHWMPWTKEQLVARGISTLTPLMPEPWKPNYATYSAELEKHPINEETILIGHSCGAAFLVRWLGDHPIKVKALLLVAPWKIPDEDPNKKAFYNYPIHPEIAQRVENIFIFTSDTEEEDGKRSARLFHDTLGGDLISLPNHGHYTLDDMGTKQFPELIDLILHLRQQLLRTS